MTSTIAGFIVDKLLGTLNTPSDAYAKDDSARDYGFSWFYVVINLYAFMRGICSGYFS